MLRDLDRGLDDDFNRITRGDGVVEEVAEVSRRSSRVSSELL
jgi:hypothetical protein